MSKQAAKAQTAVFRRDRLSYLKRHKWMYLLMLPGLIYFLVFTPLKSAKANIG